MKRILLYCACAALLVSCREDKTPVTTSVDLSVNVRLSQVSGRTATWKAGDYVYFSDDAATRPGYQFTVTPESLSADGTLLQASYKSASAKAGTIYAISAPQGRIRMKKTEDITIECDGSLYGSSLPAGIAPVGQELSLSPTLGVAEFSMSLPGVAGVRIMANRDIIPAKVKYDFADNSLTVLSSKKMVEIPVDGPGTYYIPLVPGSAAIQANVDFLSEGGQTLASATWNGSFNSKAGEIISLGALDAEATDVIDPDAPDSEQAAAAVKAMGVGVNLSGSFDSVWDEMLSSADRNIPSTYERMNGNGLNTQATLDAIAAAGFKCVRIPITWSPHMDSPGSTIDKPWLDRIGEVVNYTLNAGMYCIINLHHDTGAPVSGSTTYLPWIIADKANYETITTAFQNVWKQIATYFKNYDEKLLFEGYNEILDSQKSWFTPKDEGGFETANKLNQDFVNAVRRTGGRNVTRNLVVSTYSCGDRESSLQGFAMPTDLRNGHLIVQVHSYWPAAFVTVQPATAVGTYDQATGLPEIQSAMARVKRHIVDKGWPCVMGEYGASPFYFSADYSQRIARAEEERAKHALDATMEALKIGIAPLYWYIPMDGNGRSSGKWTYPKVKDALIQAWNEYNAQ